MGNGNGRGFLCQVLKAGPTEHGVPILCNSLSVSVTLCCREREKIEIEGGAWKKKRMKESRV